MTRTTPGFQASETSHADLILYSGPSDSVLPNASKRLEFTGLSERDRNPSLISLTTTKTMGQPAGVWSAQAKSGTGGSLGDLIVDDQWVDIVFYRWGKPYATMRGTVDRVTKSTTVTGNGVTTEVWNITGRDFGKQFDMTPVWFNQWANENVLGAAALKVIDSVGVGGDVAETVQKLLFGFLEALTDKGRGNWVMPSDMPSVTARSAFIDNIAYDASQYTDDPPRKSILPNFMDPQGGGVWQLAQEWSDPAFCELWCDTLPYVEGSGLDGNVFQASMTGAQEQLTPQDVNMCVVLRDRPFPTLDGGTDSPYFSLPTAEVGEQEIIADELSRGGDERYNAFFVASQVIQELMLQGNIDITAPLWDSGDMLVHGIRRFDVNCRYIVDTQALAAKNSILALGGTVEEDGALLTLSKSQRRRARDWYCLNPYLWSGTVQLAHGRPDIHVGMRMKTAGRVPTEDFTAYVEQVSHSWSLGPGVRTNLGVTRGWYGTDTDYLNRLRSVAGAYTGGRGQSG